MHTVYYVLTPKEDNENQTPLEAMNQAQGELDQNNFAGEGGFFSNHKADWYVVGGRWSTLLVERHEWAKQAIAEIQQMLSENRDADGKEISIRGTHYGSSATQKKQAELRERAEKIWGKYRPKDYPKVKYDRWTDANGETVWHPDNQDCAELLTPELLDYLHGLYDGTGGEIEVFNPSEYEETTIDYIKEHAEDYVGKYWLTVIDYHC